MGKIRVFNFISLNGYFEAPGGDISWHKHGADEDDYAAWMLRQGDILLFGRITYELMAGFWPTELAIKNYPAVAAGMNKAEKIVFSKTLEKVEWSNSKLIKENIIDEMKRMKQSSERNMTILGSGSIVTQFAENDLIDDYQLMVDPVVLGNGTIICKGLNHTINLELKETRTFKSGIVLLCYKI